MIKPLVSILIPSFNAAAFLTEAVESALGQTYRDLEVIVVDDGSTDETPAILEELSSRNGSDRFRFELGKHRGGCEARNRALELSKGEFVNFLDADDELEPNKIELQLPPLIENQADCCLCKVGLIWPSPRPRAAESKQHPIPDGDPFLYFSDFPIQTGAPLHRRSLVERVRGFRPGLRRGQETDFHLRLGLAGARLTMIEEILVWVRMHDGPRVSKTHHDPVNHLKSLFAIADHFDLDSEPISSRRKTLSSMLLCAAESSCRHGFIEEGKAAYTLAYRLDPECRSNSRVGWAYSSLAKMLGPARAEVMMHRLRNVKSKTSPEPSQPIPDASLS